MSDDAHTSLLSAVLGDGRALLATTGTALVLSGGFAIFQSIMGDLLPHDVHALGMTTAELSRSAGIRLLHFMFHDRVAFGGTLLSIGIGYWWLALFPLRRGEQWAWWTYVISGTTGFLSFLAYLGYGYLDTWHAVATMFLLPVFVAGLWRSRTCIPGSLHFRFAFRHERLPHGPYGRWGRTLLLACSAGLTLAGITIVMVGMTRVFVPQDLAFMRMSRADLQAISPMLIPVVAHDRAGLGGGLLSTGLLIGMIVWNARLTRSLVEVIGLMGVLGFGAALGVHVAIGYVDLVHLAPAYAGALLFLAGVTCYAIGLAREISPERSLPAAAPR